MSSRGAFSLGVLAAVLTLSVSPALAATNTYVTFEVGAANEIIELEATLTVPEPLDRVGTVFLWPGLQPGGKNFQPIDNGVLQTVLTWGPSCAPDPQPAPYSTWWISAQYVNTVGHEPGYSGCSGGNIMSVAPGDRLHFRYWLDGTVWRQSVEDLGTGKTVSYDIDLRGQAQNYAHFDIESWGGSPVSTVEYTDIRLAFRKPEPGGCRPTTTNSAQRVIGAAARDGGRVCRVQRIEMHSPKLPDLAAPPAKNCSADRSRSGDAGAEASFVNRSPGIVQIFWIDYDGKPQRYGTLDAGDSTSAGSFVTHVWEVVDTRGRCLGTFVVKKGKNTFTIE